MNFGLRQSAYHVLVASSRDILAADQGDLWDSGRVPSSRSHAVAYAGKELGSRQKCWWKVRVWNEKQAASAFSEAASFEMGLLRPQDWIARWIGWPGGRAGQAAYFRCTFELDFVPDRARLYCTGLGLYEAYVNGHRLEGVLQPALSDPSKRVYYNTYDITEMLRAGENVIAACVGSGWHGKPMLLAQLEAEDAGGRRFILPSIQVNGKPTWMTASGPVGYNSIFDGETYDARCEIPGWERPGYKPAADLTRTAQWMPACVVPPPGGKLQAQPIESIAVVDTLAAASLREPQPRVFVFDFGRNHAGWARLRVSGPRGARIRLRFAESLRENGTVNQDNLRTAAAEDTYILKGDGIEKWEARFTYHGYRYVQVEGWPGQPDIGSVTSCIVRSPLADRATFSCSDVLLNRIHQMVRRTEESNLHGIPTDCPQRDERMGWLNDMTARTEELVYNFEAARFLLKFLDDIADTQDEETGAIGDTAPFHWGFRPADPVNIAYLLIPILLHQHYGDMRPMERHYAGMQRWVDFLTTQTTHGILHYSHFGDWAPPETEAIATSKSGALSARTPGELTSTAFYYYTLTLFARISNLVDQMGNTAYYKALADRARLAFHDKFWNETISGYGSGNQACNAIALYFDLVPATLRGRVVGALLAEIKACDFHLSTGNLATKYLLEVLSREGHGDVALRIATQRTYPSWGYMLEKGATTLWERWEEKCGTGMNSHNHPMLGSVGSWLYRHVAGIRFQDDGEAHPCMLISIPRLTGITSAQASVQTIHGPVSVKWRRTEGTLTVKTHIPWNCPAMLQTPEGDRALAPGDHAITFPADIPLAKLQV